MPSTVINYVPGSGFCPLFSGNPWSGQPTVPVGGIQLRAAPQNSGYLYISLSGAYPVSGVMSTLVGSGGPTINSGTWAALSGNPIRAGGTGIMDAMPLAPGDTYFLPKIADARFAWSGQFGICVGQDPACSGGFGRLFVEGF